MELPYCRSFGRGESQPWPFSRSLRLLSVCTRELGDVGADTSDMRFQTTQVHAGQFCFAVADGAWNPRIQQRSFLGPSSPQFPLFHLWEPAHSPDCWCFVRRLKLGDGSKAVPQEARDPCCFSLKPSWVPRRNSILLSKK